MRTTLDIDDDVLQAAKELSAREQKSAGKLISEWARRGICGPVEHGFDPLEKTRALTLRWHASRGRDDRNH